MKIVFWIIVISVAGALLGYAFTRSQNDEARPLNEQKNSETRGGAGYDAKSDAKGDVDVTALPIDLSENAASWDFKITLETHSVELDDDLVLAASLIDEKRVEYQPTAWDGDPPGGHHREGLLQFMPLSPRPASLTLKLNGIGGEVERVFSWQIE
ncbi:MAG: hypothetical protein A3C90_01155 [Candidatus Magasanikbacteria bacterium RIFCSPHIGHO2_02_FULL_51_14]|uniref:DUF4352 domain-containing protein n=1 Tax=Candidatus Magasanikbacteria bacterium RIFCSPHIGHO2_02_FULL_51_14 TaxID=1798683 RepID=A0A1F6MQE2_9BACT|nr:MAG: hypothetical protein A3C90_01155 [Candidatus Magasanikbacteria bacterium RIFCSPHIGHO2_02_FULL_51_14]